MDLLDLTLETLEENLALDEALLLQTEERGTSDSTGNSQEILRLWESPTYAVILGRASKVVVEVQQDVCEEQGIPILRRTSGGCSVVIGPGCLMYSVILSLEKRPHLRAIDVAHRFVMGTIYEGIKPRLPELEIQGSCDLTFQNRKFSGNSLQIKRHSLLYHGTLLYDFDLSKITQLLRFPPREPDYRASRSHDEFLTNLPLDASQLKTSLSESWQASSCLNQWPLAEVKALVAERYSQKDWTFSR